MNVILIVEAVCIGWVAWVAVTAWLRHGRIKQERILYQKSGKNGLGLLSLLEREDRELDIVKLNAACLCFNVIIFAWRINDVLRHTVLWAAAGRDAQIFYVSWWAWNFARKRREAEEQVTETSDADYQRALSLSAARREINAKLDDVGGKLDAIKEQSEKARTNGTVG